MGGGIRVGVDVGGTFTKAVALTVQPLTLRAHAVVPTSHTAAAGVTEGVAAALRALLDDLEDDRDRVELVAYSTTQAMNALLEGDVARVGVIGIGVEPELRLARKRTQVGDLKLAPGRVLHTEHAFLDATRGLDAERVDAVLDEMQAAECTALAVSGAFSVDTPEHERIVAARARERGLPVCAGHELTGTYGLETRTVSAAVNASILPVVERTARVRLRPAPPRHRAGVADDHQRPGGEPAGRVGPDDRTELVAVAGIVQPVVGGEHVEPGDLVDLVDQLARSADDLGRPVADLLRRRDPGAVEDHVGRGG